MATTTTTTTTLTGVMTDKVTGETFEVTTSITEKTATAPPPPPPVVIPPPPPPPVVVPPPPPPVVVPPPPPVLVQSPDNTTVTNTTGSLIDASLRKWMITAARKCIIGSLLDTTTSNVTGILLHSSKIYHWNASGSWYLRADGANPPWTATTDPRIVAAPPPPPPPVVVPPPPPPVTVPPPPPTLVQSPDNTTVTNTTGNLIDASLQKWMITVGGQCLIGTAPDTTTANVVGILLHSSKIYHWNTAGSWYLRGTNPLWTATMDPRIVVAPPPPVSVPPPTPASGTPQFAISGAAGMPTNGAINVNLTEHTGLTVEKALWGVSQSTNNMRWNASFADPAWVNTMAALDIRSWRLQGEGLMSAIFPSSSSSTGANWGVLDPLVANINKAFPNAVFMWTLIDAGASGGYASAPPSVIASQCGQLASYLESKGIHIHYFDVFNEPDGGTASPDQCQAMCPAVFPALAAMNKGYKFGTCPTGPRGVIVAPYPEQCIAGYPAMDYVAGHWYAGSGDAGSIADDLALGIGATGPFWQANTQNETYGGKKYPFALSEYAFSYSGSMPAPALNMIASVTYAQILANGAMNGTLWEAGVWDGGQASYGWTNSLGSLAPHCYMLARGGQTMPGNIVKANSNLNVKILATTAGIMVINTNQSGTQSGSIAIGGLGNPSLRKWQQAATDSSGNFSNNAGVTSTITVSDLANQNFPALSVTIYSP